jgi:hypothetical protein
MWLNRVPNSSLQIKDVEWLRYLFKSKLTAFNQTHKDEMTV